MKLPDRNHRFWDEEIALSELPDHIACDILENRDDENLVSLTRREAIEAWLEWNGIIGYTSSIIDLFSAVVSEEKLP